MSIRRMNRSVLVLVALLIVALASVGVSAQRQFVSIATGGVTGVYYPLGGAMAEIISANVSGVIANAESTGASVANANALGSGDTELALLQNDIAFYAATGTEMFTTRNTKLLGITM